MSVHMPILRRLLLHPRRVCAIDDRRTYRGMDVVIAALNLTRELKKCGLDGPIGVMVPTSAAFPICALAGWMLGRTVVPLNYLLKPEELQYVIDDAGVKCLVTVGPMLEHLGISPRAEAIIKLEDLNLAKLPPLMWPKGAKDDDLACLLYTSGTSGRPKGVELTHANLSANVRQIGEWVDFSTRDVMLGVLPQFHSFGLTVLTLLPFTRGIKVVYSARFVPNRIVKLFREHRPTVFVAIPSMYRALLGVKSAAPEDFTSLRYAVSGGEPLPDDVATRFKERFDVTIAEGYGMTECAPVTHWCRPHEFKHHSVGRAIPDVDQRIVNPDTNDDLPANTDGELRLKGPNIMRGYKDLPDETAATFDDRGYLRTGDMARLDNDGHLFITGRIKEMMIVGGENVFPREIEEVLDSHPAVSASGVVGMTDPVRGEVPVAFVELEDGQTVETSDLTSLCRERLAGYKVPRDIRVLDALPRNPTGKVMRRELKSLLESPA